uniref:Fibronectin type-III domain-containing protein n=1 Tax=Amphimedon queenslandica TaxID=400682 RepID=A0A1X7TP60_AMPQE
MQLGISISLLGLLDSVVDLDYTFINGSSVLLTWTAPYTLDNVPITGYYIVVNEFENFTTINNNTITLRYQLLILILVH